LRKERYLGLRIVNISCPGDNINVEKIYMKICYMKACTKLKVPACGYDTFYEDMDFDDVKIYPKKYRKYFRMYVFVLGHKI